MHSWSSSSDRGCVCTTLLGDQLAPACQCLEHPTPFGTPVKISATSNISVSCANTGAKPNSVDNTKRSHHRPSEPEPIVNEPIQQPPRNELAHPGRVPQTRLSWRGDMVIALGDQLAVVLLSWRAGEEGAG